MLESWHEFYGLLGTAAAALVALLFVAASIGTGYLSTDRNSPTRTFTTPVVFHYTFVLFVSLIALVPIDTDRSLAIVIGISAAGALLYAVFILIRVLRSAMPDIEDHIGYGACPPVAYAATLAAAAASRRRAYPSLADQHPQRLGSDGVFRAAPQQRKPA
jgi:hypothetical protein